MINDLSPRGRELDKKLRHLKRTGRRVPLRNSSRPGPSIRGTAVKGTAVVAVLVVLMVSSLLAHQTVKSLWILRQGQRTQVRLAQASAVLELGRFLENRFSIDRNLRPSDPLIVSVGEEFAKIEFAFLSEIETFSNRILVTFPVDVTGAELPNVSPVAVSWERTDS